MATGPSKREVTSEKEWNDTPLFMRELPKDYENNEQLAALQALVHEGPPDGGLVYLSSSVLFRAQFFFSCMFGNQSVRVILKIKGTSTSRTSSIEKLLLFMDRGSGQDLRILSC